MLLFLQNDDHSSLFVNLDEAALAQLSSQPNVHPNHDQHIQQFSQQNIHSNDQLLLVPDQKVVVIDQAKAQRDIEEKEQVGKYCDNIFV